MPNPPKVYHVTLRRFLPQILREGLRPNRKEHLTSPGARQWAQQLYGCWPIFLSLRRPWERTGDLVGDLRVMTTLMVDLPANQEVCPDVVSLVDHGAYVSEYGLGWSLDEAPMAKQLEPFLTDGDISWDELFNDHEVINAAIKVTQTFATCQAIPAERLRVMGTRRR